MDASPIPGIRSYRTPFTPPAPDLRQRRTGWRWGGCFSGGFPGRLLAVSLILFLAGCAEGEPEPLPVAERGTPPAPLATCPVEDEVTAAPVDLEIREVAGGLEVPWALAPTPDGRVLVTERPGRIRVLSPDGLDPEPWMTLEVSDRDEGGLMGIALAPDFAATGHAYVMISVDQRDGEGWFSTQLRRVQLRLGLDVAPHRIAQVLRVTEVEGRGTDPRVILEGVPSGLLHAGGALAMLPGGDLLISHGDAGIPPIAQVPDDLRGKLFRVPLDPTTGLPSRRTGPEVKAVGVRNSQGVAVMPDSASVLFIDHGPSGLVPEDRRQAKDELNLLPLNGTTFGGAVGQAAGAPGPGNFGWPVEAGIHEEPIHTPPIVEWSPAVAPAGLTVMPVPGRDDRAWAFVTGLRGETLLRVELARDLADTPSWSPICQVELLDGEFGRLRAVTIHPDGGILVGTSNRDGRGRARNGDDRLLHLQL